MPSATLATVTLLQRYAEQLRIPMPAEATSLQLLVDDRYPLRLRPLPGDGILVCSLLRPLPPAGPVRDDLLRAFARLACGTMKEQPTTCSIDAHERGIWLQLAAPARSLQDIDEAVGQFVNSLAFWSKTSPAV